MRIPGLTLLEAPSPQPPLSEHEQHTVARPLLEALGDAAAASRGDQDGVLFVEATEQLAQAVHPNGPLALLGETYVKSELSINNHSDTPDALDLALAQDSASGPESADSQDEFIHQGDQSISNNGIEGQADDDKDDDDDDNDNSDDDDDNDDDEGSTSESDDETISNIIGTSQLHSMEEVVGDQDDEEDESASKKNALKTAHETIEESGPVDLTNVTVDPNAPLQCLGTIERLMDSLAIVKAQTDGEYCVLSEGSLALSESRALVGAISETFGPVKQPRYVVRLTEKALSDMSLGDQQQLFYIPNQASFVFTQALHSIKGSDASNFYDEEVDDNEREFSDDEAEIEHKRSLKRKRKPETEPNPNTRQTANQRIPPDRDQYLTYRPLSRPSHYPISPPSRNHQSRRHPDSRQERVHPLPPAPPALETPQHWAEYSPSPFHYSPSYPPPPIQVPHYASLPPGAYVNPTFFVRGESQPLRSPPLPPEIQQQIDILNNIQRHTHR